MPTPYSHKHFFRKIPPSQLARYFASKEVDLGIDFSAFNIKQVDSLFSAFTGLPEGQQTTFESEFQDIHAMACDGGIQALIDESAFHKDDGFVAAISEIDGLHAKVMWAYLEKQYLWQGATLFLHADNVSSAYWKKRNDFPPVSPDVEDSAIKALADSISAYFNKTEGRGRNCKVEPYRRHNKEYFFAYPEDFGLSAVEWIGKDLKSRARHPAFEIIFVYCESEGSLDIYAPRNTKSIPELQKLFANTILHLDTLPDGSVDKRVYDLNPLADAEFMFQVEPDSGIERIEVMQLRLTLKYGSKKRIILEADTKHDPSAIYDLLGLLKPPPHYITQARVKVIFEPKLGKRARTRTFNITYPNSLSLGHDGDDLKIRNILAKSGIEPRA
ncbi:MAG: hypothetical protein HOP23_18420 [Methylococcaceae bacterium]|nr:hypothetical protein [Methylococcaceae bacterium]